MSAMTPKERVKAALRREPPDRVPTGENQMDGRLIEQVLGRPVLCHKGWEELQALWNGRRDEVARDYGEVHADLPLALEWDYVRVPVVPARRGYRPPQMTGPYSWIDERGEEVQLNPDAGSLIMRRRYPDLGIDDLPDPDEPFTVDPSELEAVRRVAERIGRTHFIIGRTPVDGSFPWEYSIGMENFMVKMLTEPGFVRRAVDVFVNRSIAYIRAMIEAGADAVMTVDDYSDNRGPIMGLELFREFVLPGIRRQIEAAHAAGGCFIKHTDGNTWELLDDLIEAGIDGWHGIQRNIGMDLGKLKERFGKRLCFFGGVNAETLIDGTPAQVREEVRTAVEQAGAGGGLVLTCSNVVAPGARLENYLAQRQALRDFGG